MLRTDQARPAARMTPADLEAAIAALPVRKQRLRESFDRLVACAPLHVHLPFTWDDIDAHVSSLHASFSLRFRQMQKQPHPGVPVSATETHDDEQSHSGVPVSATAAPDDEQPDPCVPVSATHDESIQEEEEVMVREVQDASPVPETKGDKVSLTPQDARMYFVGAPCHLAGGTRDHEFPVHAPDAGYPMLQQPYMAAFPPDAMSQLQVPTINPPMLQRQPYMAYRQEFPMVQQPYLPYFRQEFFPDVMRQPPMGIDHVLQQQYMAHHQHHFHVAQAASAQGQGSNGKRRPSRTANTDIINVLNARSKKSRTIGRHNAKPKPNGQPCQKKTIYDYF